MGKEENEKRSIAERKIRFQALDLCQFQRCFFSSSSSSVHFACFPIVQYSYTYTPIYYTQRPIHTRIHFLTHHIFHTVSFQLFGSEKRVVARAIRSNVSRVSYHLFLTSPIVYGVVLYEKSPLPAAFCHFSCATAHFPRTPLHHYMDMVCIELGQPASSTTESVCKQ